MIVRIRLGRGRALKQTRGTNRGLALAAEALLVPVALMAYVLGIWRLACDAGVTGEFAMRGVFSHWQVWIAIALATHGAASVLNRYGRGGTFPRLTAWLAGSRKPGDVGTPRPGAR